VDHPPARPSKPTPPPLRPGRAARAAGRTLHSYTIGALPIRDRFFGRLRLRSILRDHLQCEDRRCRIASVTGLLLLLKNLFVSREPLYGIGERAARHVPALLGLCPAQLPSLNDDRVGRCLDRLFDADIPTLALAVVVQAVREFAVDLDELPNDSTTITFHGDYESAERERTLRGRLRLAELRARLAAPRTRHRERAKVAEAVEAILGETGTEGEIAVTIEERTEETFLQQRRGRPTAETLYVKRERKRFELTYRVDAARLAEAARCDGVFPLISNELTISAKDLLLAYKQQPMIEKRFAQLKTDFVVAPVYLKEVSRIQALLCVYFFALLVESLLERELRRVMESEGIESLPLYPEGRACRWPTARKVFDLFEEVQRHELSAGHRPAVVFITKLSRLQRRILRLLKLRGAYDT
jgi:hypothetical protein